MAVRSKDVHDRLLEIHRRHWNAVAKRNGVAESAEAIIEEVLASTAVVLERLQAQLPADFPGHVAESIFRGVRVSADRLAKMPRG
jgi:serine/threonine-protein kinase HipA